MIRAFSYREGVAEEIAQEQIASRVHQRVRHGAGKQGVAGPTEFIWLHIRSNGEAESFLEQLDIDLPAGVSRALVAVETRPRCELFESGVLVNLRLPGIEGQDVAGVWMRRVRRTLRLAPAINPGYFVRLFHGLKSLMA